MTPDRHKFPVPAIVLSFLSNLSATPSNHYSFPNLQVGHEMIFPPNISPFTVLRFYH
jgi:hypothetical protein